ncbi:aldo-keto reductase family 1 member A1-like isoform X3 [Bacillus rossius redtenbacheri]|uniref:aldo-keto reductase family 1 member A1-like isoform X3 n=1 Tax=Bacillus rossius redtenbacheri TaxID=93214 RepID=UPI002FDE0F39
MIPRVQLSDGSEMPVIGLGIREMPVERVERAVRDAVDVGYRHFDCAAVHGSERQVGAALRGKMAEGVVGRKDLFVCSKLWNTCHRPERVVAACRSSLQNLGLDYLDLYLMHWPVAFQDGDEPFPRDADGRLLHEDADYLPAYREMEQCVRLGLARSIGLANFNSEQLARVLSVATIPPVNNQVQRGTYPLPKSQDKDHMIENTQIFDFDLSTGDMHDLDVFDSRMRFYPFIESKDDYNYPFGVDF